ncbi:hypothetical protein FGB62_73g112 [Gracilaria domingensis]|nr:hypothetical protein FGB62_73g112 [Gracilaria domingensis]
MEHKNREHFEHSDEIESQLDLNEDAMNKSDSDTGKRNTINAHRKELKCIKTQRKLVETEIEDDSDHDDESNGESIAPVGHVPVHRSSKNKLNQQRNMNVNDGGGKKERVSSQANRVRDRKLNKNYGARDKKKHLLQCLPVDTKRSFDRKQSKKSKKNNVGNHSQSSKSSRKVQTTLESSSEV